MPGCTGGTGLLIISGMRARSGGDHFILWGDMPIIRDAIIETFATADRGGS